MARVDFPQQAYYTALGVSMTKEKQDHLYEPAWSLGWFDMPNFGVLGSEFESQMCPLHSSSSELESPFNSEPIPLG